MEWASERETVGNESGEQEAEVDSGEDKGWTVWRARVQSGVSKGR